MTEKGDDATQRSLQEDFPRCWREASDLREFVLAKRPDAREHVQRQAGRAVLRYMVGRNPQPIAELTLYGEMALLKVTSLGVAGMEFRAEDLGRRGRRVHLDLALGYDPEKYRELIEEIRAKQVLSADLPKECPLCAEPHAESAMGTHLLRAHDLRLLERPGIPTLECIHCKLWFPLAHVRRHSCGDRGRQPWLVSGGGPGTGKRR